MTNKALILKLLAWESPLTCAVITQRIIKEKYQNKPQPYLSGSISSTLAKMVKDDILEYTPGTVGPKGGHFYQLSTKETNGQQPKTP